MGRRDEQPDDWARGRAGSPAAIAVGTLLVALASAGGFAFSARVVTRPPAWRTFEFCQYAEIGRNLAVEGRYDTRLVEPMALAMLDRAGASRPDGRWPVVDRYPLPCLVVAGLMRQLGPTDLAAAWSNGLAMSLLAALTYAAARSWLGPRWAIAAAVLFLANPAFYGEFVLLGTPDVWFAALFLAELLAWSSRDPASDGPPRRRRAVGLGALGGLSYLSRFNASLFLAPQVAALLARRRWSEAACMVGTAILVVSPLLAYNTAALGRPVASLYSSWNLLDGIGAYPAEPWLYYRVPDVAAEAWAHRAGLAAKFAANLLAVVPTRIGGLWRLDFLLPLAWIAPALAPKGSASRRLAGWSVGLFALQLAVFSALRLELPGRNWSHNGRYFFWFAAPALISGLGAWKSLARRHRLARLMAGAAIIGQLALFGIGWRDLLSRHGPASRMGTDPLRRLIAQTVPDGRVIASNQPQVTAWLCGRRSISMPADLDELRRLNELSPTPADYLLVDMNFNAIMLADPWVRLARGAPGVPPNWLARLLQDYEFALPPEQTQPLAYVLLRRRGVQATDPAAGRSTSPRAAPAPAHAAAAGG